MPSNKTSVYIRIIAIACLSRTLIMLLSYLPTLVFELFDKSTLLLQSSSPFKHLIVWDAVHFLHIADFGYAHEHAIPFFPLTPLIARTLPIKDNTTSGILLNNFAFIVSAALLYKVSLKMYSHRISYLSSIFFIFNPASIVYSSFYSESLFCMLFLMALYYLQAGRMLRASTFLGLCSLTRSNTVMFLLFLKSIYFPIVIAPLALYQLYNLFLIMRLKTSFRFLIPYSYIQIVYWGQGFLKFIRPWHIPNMLFGLIPIIYGIYVCIKYFESRLYMYNAHRGEPVHGKEKSNTNEFRGAIDSKAGDCIDEEKSLSARQWLKQSFWSTWAALRSANLQNLLGWLLDPFRVEATTATTKLAIILGMQMITVLCFIHWNMAFRFISFNPLLYWAFATLFETRFHNKMFRASACVLFVYGMVYAVLFGCFYPPA